MIIKLDKYIRRDLDRVLFEKGEHMGKLKERADHRPDKESLSEPEWLYLIDLTREAYISGAERVCTELNKRADAEVREAQEKAERRIYRELAEIYAKDNH